MYGLIYDQLECPRDKFAFRTQCQNVPKQTEICLDTRDPNAYLTLMRQRHWTSVISFGVPDDIAYWGRYLESLEIRTTDSVSLNFVEFLPNLKELRVACSRVTTGIGWNAPTVERVDIITSLSVYVHPEISSMTSLTHLSVEAGEIRTADSTRLPPSLKTVHITGTTRDSFLDALAASSVETLSLRRALLCELPRIPKSVVSLDLTGNYISEWDSFEHAAGLRLLNISGNMAFDVSTLYGLPIEFLDARGTGDEYPSLPTLKKIVHSHEPPSNIGQMCPDVDSIIVRPPERVPIPGWDIPRLAHHGYFHPELGHVKRDETPPPSPGAQWTSYIDNIDILYQPGGRDAMRDAYSS